MKNQTSIINYLIALVLILSLNFILPRLMPGDPLLAIYGDEAFIAMTPELKAELVSRFALDQSTSQQFWVYISSLVRGDLGYSYYYNAPVMAVILGSLPWTVLLVGLAIIISTLVGVALGIESGYRRGRPLDRALLGSLMFASGFPDFFVGILLLLFFGVVLGLVPLAGAVTPYAGYGGLTFLTDLLRHLALPLTALAMVRIADPFLLTRNAMVISLGEPFIFTARAKGCPDKVIRYRHVGKNSLLPVITATGMQLPHMVTRALFIEIVFSYPGVGSLLYNALLTRDYPLLQGILLVLTVTVLLVNLLVDIVYTRLDPRIAYAY
ncbi:peptide/nickel transport system permease protein [Desulfotomaculum arcticum]|uniref:Peptide/nickel transport system permease protein n=1 Tax=Desulfotruncus arcticus DSM 17038 TaxID=1121424 RepID=A0A1I2T4B8_9FIRM|nr:ABC transporter permease [Desulfotruncus arcticus]SFG58017.1 peptide/nickel transport system permease protein [Desulfotomaculum arcticum] [Desulfotruncus arcticus DSM 17038]